MNRSQLRLNVVSDFLCESTSATSRVSNNAITLEKETCNLEKNYNCERTPKGLALG